MNRSKTAAMGAAMLTLLLAITGCGQEGTAGVTPVATLSNGAGDPDDTSQVTEAPVEPSQVVEDPADLGLTVAAGIDEEMLKRCAELGLTAEDIAPAGVSELAFDSQAYDTHTICVYRIAGEQYPALHTLTVGLTRGVLKEAKYTLQESFEITSKYPGAVPVGGLGDKALWQESIHEISVLKGNEKLTIRGHLDAGVVPQDPGQDYYIRLAEKLLPKL